MAGMGWDFARDLPEELASEIDGCGNRRSRRCNESRDAETTRPARLQLADAGRPDDVPLPQTRFNVENAEVNQNNPVLALSCILALARRRDLAREFHGSF